MMKVSSSTNGAITLIVAICYNLLLLITELQADTSSSKESSEEDKNILTVVTWYNQGSTGYYDMPGGTAQEESEEGESENSFNVDGASIPDTDMKTGQSSTVSVSFTSSENVTPYRTTMRTNVHVGGNSDDDDDDGEGDDDIDNDESDEENETDNEDNGGGGGTVPVTIPATTKSPDGGKRTSFPVRPLSGKHCFVFQNQPNQQLCQCDSKPPKLPELPKKLQRSSPVQIKRRTRQHSDCNILCICWILAFVGVLIGAVCKVSQNRRTHF
eukprot:XP_011668234.1 PREDICTED: nucleolin-like [Strongylocentrotus purpuratus]